MGVKETLIGLWWLYDIVFVLGMLTAFNADDVKNNMIKKLSKYVIDTFVYTGKIKMPPHVMRKIDRSKGHLTYGLIKLLLGVSFTLNFLINVIAEERRSPIVNSIYFFYTFLTIFVSAHDILFHDDKSEWSLAAKRRHIVFPVNLEDSRVFSKPTYGNQTKTQLYDIKNKLKTSGAPFSVFLVLGLYNVLPQLHFIWCFFLLGAHNHVNQFIVNAFDYFCVSNFRNRYDHALKSMTNVFFANEKHDQLGRQYKYFENSCVPLEKVLKKQIFDKARAKKWSVKESKALTYLARGVFVSCLFWLYNLQKQDFLFETEKSNELVKFLSGSAPTMLYYAFHAGIAYYDKEAAISDTPFKRILCFLVESSVAGLFFYRPLIEVTRPSYLHKGIMACAGVSAIPTALAYFGSKLAVIDKQLKRDS